MQPTRLICSFTVLALLGCGEGNKTETPKEPVGPKPSADLHEPSQHIASGGELVLGNPDPQLWLLEPSGRLELEPDYGPMGIPELPAKSCADGGGLWCIQLSGALPADGGRGVGGKIEGSKPDRRPILRTRNLAFSGDVDQDRVQRIFEKEHMKFLYCYEKELQSRAELAGELHLRVTVGAEGRVETARVADSSLADPAVESCVERVASRINFETARSQTTISQELHLSSVKRDLETD